MEVSPSLLSANFANLIPDIEMINNSEADYLHLDVMDGVFVPNISFGFPVIDAVAKICKKPLDVHLMIINPEKWIGRVRDTGACYMNIHIEACTHLHSIVSQIKTAGMKAAVTLNPATPVFLLEDILEDLDMVLLMSVNPGFGGQKFIPGVLNKIRHLKEMINKTDKQVKIQVDGGINEETGKLIAEAGADVAVAGSYIFNSSEPLKRINSLKKL